MNKSKEMSGNRLKKQIRNRNIAVIVFLAACITVVCGVPIYNIYCGDDVDSWYVNGAHIEIAAQPADDPTPVPVQEEILPSPSPEQAEPAWGYLTASGSDSTAEPTAEPTPEPTAEPTPEPAVETAEETVAEPAVEPAAEPTPIPEVRTITISAAGDCTLGGNVPTGGDARFEKYAKKYGYDYFLKEVRSIFENDDITIVNLETTLTTSKDMRPGRKFNFRGKPAYVQILAGSSVEICNLANNHTLDYKKAGMMETAKVLREAGIGCSGYTVSYTTEVKGVKVCSLGFTEWDYTSSEVKAACQKARKDCDILIVSMHAGREYNYTATSTQKKIAHAAIDGGADIVLGHHPHVVGGIEKYKGKYIAYSLGNFCYGGHSNPSDKDTMIFQQTFEVAPDGTVSDGGINIIPAHLSSTTASNNFQPIVLGEKKGKALLKKIAKYSKVSMSEIKWMPGSYMEKLGYVNQPTQAPGEEKVYTSLIEALEAD